MIRYVLKTERDVEILSKCRKLERAKLSKEDRESVRLIKSQLENDWRKPLIKKLDIIVKKYS